MSFTLVEIREHLQDFPERNFLLDEEEFTDRQIEIAFKAAVSAFNSFPPIHIQFTAGVANSRYKDIILEGTLARLYRGKYLEQFRNQLDFQDGGAAGSIDNKGQPYLQASETMWANFERRSRDVKKYLNINDSFGQIGSDYETLPFY